MSFPEGTIHYAGDHVILAGDMTPDQVAACVAAGAKSWLPKKLTYDQRKAALKAKLEGLVKNA